MQSVTSILADIRGGTLSPREAIARSLDAIAEKDAPIGAFAVLAGRDDLLAQAARATGPLAGIAIGVKDIYDTFDLPTSYGSAVYAGHQPMSDAALVALARRAGASIVGKTFSTEYAFLTPAGTRNPHDLEHTPGGSSSGSAAAVAAGMVAAAFGTQTGGSVIRPAAYCGIAGFKPSFRLLPVTGTKTFSWTLDTAGLFAASVADVAALAAALSGRELEVETVDPVGLRIGVYRGGVHEEASPEALEAVEALAQRAQGAGATLVDIAEPAILTAARDIHATIQNYEAALSLGGDLARHGARMSDTLRGTLEEGAAIAPARYDDARRVARHARHAATEMFGEVDVIIEPATPGPAPRGLSSTGSPLFNKLWTLTGNPAVNIPGAVAANGLPLGVQLVARFGRDRLALSAGAWLEGLG